MSTQVPITETDPLSPPMVSVDSPACRNVRQEVPHNNAVESEQAAQTVIDDDCSRLKLSLLKNDIKI